MSQLTGLQQVSLWIGILGGLLGVLNSLQIWRKNRPIHSVLPGPSPADEDIIISVTNISSRPVTIIKSFTWPEKEHSLFVPDASTRHHIQSAMHKEINEIVQAGETKKFSFIYTGDRWVLLLISWYSNGAFLFSRIPLVVLMSKATLERVRRSRMSESY